MSRASERGVRKGRNSAHLFNVLHHDALDVLDLVLNLTERVRGWVVIVKLHAVLQYSRKLRVHSKCNGRVGAVTVRCLKLCLQGVEGSGGMSAHARAARTCE